MGWKTFKDHFNILETLEWREDKLLFSSRIYESLAIVDLKTGVVKPHQYHPDFLKDNYPDICKATPEEILALLNAEDKFEASIPVYTYSGSEIIEKFCEKPGWPNYTHDGLLMYANKYSIKKDRIVIAAKAENDAGISLVRSRIEQLKSELEAANAKLIELNANKEKLDKDYPNLNPE